MKRLIFIISAILMTLTCPAQQKRWAVVDLSSIYMRTAPDYESALETQELMGTIVEVIGEQGYWREIVSPQPYKAWCTEKGIIEMSEEDKIKERERYADYVKSRMEDEWEEKEITI